jgi:CheY-like chemotaxis protein
MATSTRTRTLPGHEAPNGSSTGTPNATDREPQASVEAGIAHDLNNLMTAVAGYTGMAIESLGADHPAVADLRQVADAAEQAGVLTRRLLALHRLEGGDAPVVPHDPAGIPDRQLVILLADDDAAVREFARRILEAAGHRVIDAEDGHAAMGSSRMLETIDLLVTDLDMPCLDGVGLSDALRAEHPETVVLYMSGGAAEGVAERLAGRGAGFLAKPFRGADLLAAVAATLGAVRPA